MHLLLLLLLVLSVRNQQPKHRVAVVDSSWLRLRSCGLLVRPLLVSSTDAGCGCRALVLL